MSLPGMRWRRQMFPRPARQSSQSPQGITAGTMTSRPISARWAGPAAVTTPLISWPRVRGNPWFVGTPSFQKPMSVWQTPQPATRISASSGPGSGIATSTTSSGSRTASNRIAFMCRSPRAAAPWRASPGAGRASIHHARSSPRHPAHEVIRVLRPQLGSVQSALGPVPPGDPVDGPQDHEHGHLGVHPAKLAIADAAIDDPPHRALVARRGPPSAPAGGRAGRP